MKDAKRACGRPFQWRSTPLGAQIWGEGFPFSSCSAPSSSACRFAASFLSVSLVGLQLPALALTSKVGPRLQLLLKVRN
ncbi:Dual specificity protein phosphatase Diacylglycerol kinase, catalytic region [Musa troglodytarum]|uniref:Dual specificity protein phosphatase Diacylglycerol kinase, catalytic region n=1 Tax=Musa troglodytarum TaxID=320322 RepID=A0A9E7I7I6_9LILI|nr:Dual specificity protein phosphatase Diacylglycerol kinase, catalytic region [Musa troglodytarum]